MESALLARGFHYGSAPGSVVIGWNSTHAAVTLPDGTPVSSGESGAGVRIGGGGAYQPQFSHHMYLPVQAQQMDVPAPAAPEPAPEEAPPAEALPSAPEEPAAPAEALPPAPGEPAPPAEALPPVEGAVIELTADAPPVDAAPSPADPPAADPVVPQPA